MSNVYASLKPTKHEEVKKAAPAQKQAEKPDTRIDEQVSELRNIFPNVQIDNLRLFVMQHPSQSELEQAVAQTIENDINLNKIGQEWTAKKSRGGARKQKQRAAREKEEQKKKEEEKNKESAPKVLPTQKPAEEEKKATPAPPREPSPPSPPPVINEDEFPPINDIPVPQADIVPRRGRQDRRTRAQPRRARGNAQQTTAAPAATTITQQTTAPPATTAKQQTTAPPATNAKPTTAPPAPAAKQQKTATRGPKLQPPPTAATPPARLMINVRSNETQTPQVILQDTGVQTEEIYTPHSEYSRPGPRPRRRERRGRFTYR